jgi:hypothetical protein
VRATTLEFGVWVCGIITCKSQARSWKTEALRATVGGWVGRDLCHMIRPDSGEANIVRAAVFGGQVELCLVSIRPGSGKADAVRAAARCGWVGLCLVSIRQGPGEAEVEPHSSTEMWAGGIISCEHQTRYCIGAAEAVNPAATLQMLFGWV